MTSLVLALITAVSAGCLYPSRRADGVEFSEEPCLLADGKVNERIFADLDFDKDRLAWFLIRGSDSVFYIRKDRRYRQTFWYDNGPDYFHDGLTRVVQNGKFGFMDARLRIRIPPRWDFAYPFEHGVADVGNGCEVHRLDPEHSSMVCDSSATIDRRGVVVAR